MSSHELTECVVSCADLYAVYRAELFVLHGVEQKLQLGVQVFIQIVPLHPHIALFVPARAQTRALARIRHVLTICSTVAEKHTKLQISVV